MVNGLSLTVFQVRPQERLFRIIVMSLVFMALMGTTFLLLWPLQKILNSRMEELRDSLIAQVEDFSGLEIKYGSLGPSIFGTLDIRDIRIHREDGSFLVSISRFRLSYSLFQFLLGETGGILRSARIDQPVMNTDFNRDPALLARFGGEPKTPEVPGMAGKILEAFLPDNFRVRIRNGSWNGATEDFNAGAEGLNLDLEFRNRRVNFQGNWNAGLSFPQSFGVGMTARISGEYNSDFAGPGIPGGRALLNVPVVSGNNFSLKPLKVTISLRDKILEIRKINDRIPFDFSGGYNFETGGLSGNFISENFSLRDFVSLSGSLRDYAPWMETKISGSASLIREKAGEAQYNFDFSGELPQRLSLGDSGFTFMGAGNERVVRIKELDFRSALGNARFQGNVGFEPLSPNGFLWLSDVGMGTGGEKLSGEFSVSSLGREITLFADTVTVGEVSLSALDASLVQESRGFSFTLSALDFRGMDSSAEDSYGDVRLGNLSLKGSMDFNPRNIQASMRLDSFSVGDLLTLTYPFSEKAKIAGPLRMLLNDLYVTTEIFVTTDFEHILYNAPHLVTALESKAGDLIVTTSISGTNQRFELNEGQINWGGEKVRLEGYADFSRPEDISFFMKSFYRDLGYYCEGRLLEGQSLSIRGSYGLEVYVSADPWGGFSGYALGDSIPLPTGEQSAQLDFLCSVNYASRDSWNVDIDRFEITEIPSPVSSHALLRLTGGVNQNALSLSHILYDDGEGPLSGHLNLSWKKLAGNILLDMALAGEDEQYKINASYGEEGTNLRLAGKGMRFARLSRNAYNMVASGELDLRFKSIDSFQADLNLDSLTATYHNSEVSLSAQASLRDDEFSILNLEARYGGLELVLPLFTVNRSRYRVETGGRILGESSGRGVDISFTLDAFLSPFEWSTVSHSIDSFGATLVVQNARFGELWSDEPFRFIFFRGQIEKGKPSLMTLTGGPREMIRFRYQEGGSFYAALSSPSPIRGSFIGSLDNKNSYVEAQTQDLYVDLAALWKLIPPQEAIGLAGGTVTAQVRVAGSLEDPEFFGSARGTSVRLQVPQFLAADICPAPVNVTIEGNEMTFGPVDARVGSGAGVVSGWFRFERWIPNLFDLDIRVSPQTPIPAALNINGVVARGSTAGNVVISLEDMVLSLKGDLMVQDTEIGLNASGLGQIGENSPSQISVQTDLTLTTGRKVEFVWPDRNFPVLRAYADMGTSLRLSSDSLNSRFSMLGDVRLRSGEIMYIDRSFYLQEGTLFFNENETSFNPRITARAEIRDRTDDGPVTISMIIDNAPLMSFTARFESNPPLSQVELLSLLGQSPLSSPADQDDYRNLIVSATTDVLAQFGLIRRLERTVRDVVQLDMFSVRTQVLQNMVFRAAGIGQEGNSSSSVNTFDEVERTSAVGNYFDNTTVYLGKYFGPNMFIQGMFAFKYDEERRNQEGLPVYQGLTLEPDISFELRNPLFDVRLNLNPLHPENLFVNDLSFTLTWRRSF